MFESKNGRHILRSSDATEEAEGDPFEILRRVLRAYSYRHRLEWPPFLGGAVGFISYEAKKFIEPKIFRKKKSGLSLPEIYFMFFDHGIVQDRERGEAYIFSNTKGRKILGWEKELERIPAGSPATERAAPEIRSSFTRSGFISAVHKAKDHIRRGDIYQANLSQRLDFPFRGDAFNVYENLRQINPSSFFGFLDGGDFQIISGSPERLVKLENGRLETRPIAGTRSRGKTARQDSVIARELMLNEKERAEHIMLVDLERNDMGRVAEYGSVSADELMVLEDYSHVKHIVSNVTGVLKKGIDAIDVLRSFFPGGTITGAPKVRSMEIIDQLEPVERGPYTGSMGYIGFGGNMDLNILIRSLIVKNKKAYLHVGAGIVADSIPDREYDETLYKAEGVLAAVFGREQTAGFLKKCGVSSPRVP